jgi:hypothetical protein
VPDDPDPESIFKDAKVEKAAKLNVPVVRVAWLHTSRQQHTLVNHEPYLVKPKQVKVCLYHWERSSCARRGFKKS